MKWKKEDELLLLNLKKEGKSYKEIAEVLNTTIYSVKHKYIRLNQYNNDDRHHHPAEKIEQIKRVLPESDRFRTLETNAGKGNLTTEYLKYGKVIAQDIDIEKISFLQLIDDNNLEAIKCDSFKQIHYYIYKNKTFDIIDLDPYGFPSRFFPHVFQLIDDGYLFFTFPKMGVQQINKITLNHYKTFWGITLEDKEHYQEKIHLQLQQYALFYFRVIAQVEVIDLGRMLRFVYKVKRVSAFNLFGYEHLGGGRNERMGTMVL